MSLLNSTTPNFWRKYLLGDGLKNGDKIAIAIRALVILSAIGLVWLGIALALIIHLKCQKNRLSSINNGLNDSTTSIPNKTKRSRMKNRARHQIAFHSFDRLLPRLKRRLFWKRQTSLMSSKKKSFERCSKEKQKQPILTGTILIEPKQRTLLPVKRLLKLSGSRNNHKLESDSSSGDEYTRKQHKQKHFLYVEKNTKSSIISPLQKCNRDNESFKSKNCVSTQALCAHTSLPSDESTTTVTTFRKVNELPSTTKKTLLFHPITKRPSYSTNVLAIKPVVSARELRQRDDNWLCAINSANVGENLHNRHLPLVMITDTTSSHTNIVELDTFEDQHRLLSDDERHIMKELRASYRPRHST